MKNVNKQKIESGKNKNKMQCVCCVEDYESKVYTAFTAIDKKLYHELARIEFDPKRRGLKICLKCKIGLKTSVEFLRGCLEAYKNLNSDVVSPRKRGSGRKKKAEEAETLQIQAEISDEECDQDFQQEDELQQAPTVIPVIFSSADEPAQHETHAQLMSPENQIIIISQAQVSSETEIMSEHFFENIQPEEEKSNAPQQNEVIPSEPPERKNGKFECPDCGNSFSTAQRLEVHSFTHSGIKNWSCNDCEKVFATKFRLRAHLRTHTGERPFKCDECPLSFAQGNALKCHKRVHSKERPFVCQICSKSFSQNTTLKTHMSALHTGKNVSCDFPGCDKKFTRRSYMILHKRDHTGVRMYSCDRCPNQYKQKSHLDRHIESSHLGIRHKCDHPGCSAEFSKSWSLKMHKFVHSKRSDQLPYPCQICQTSFYRRDKWIKHIDNKHPDEAEELKRNNFQITSNNEQNTNFVMMTTPEIYTIQNYDGSITQVQTLELVEEEC